MTIGMAFNCYDGLIMGADRQMTASGWHKFSDKKLFFDVRDERILSLVGADDLSLANEVWWKLLDHPIADAESCAQALTGILDSMGRLQTDLPLQVMCGLATKANTFVLGFWGKGIQAIDDFGVIGAGDSSLIRYLSKYYVDLDWQNTNQAAIAACYFLKPSVPTSLRPF